jgi:hypothetical protein
LQEVIMTSGTRRRAALLALAVTSIALASQAALASQGPGTSAGTASTFTQLAMAILVYGTSALVIGAGLIGALRKSEPKH